MLTSIDWLDDDPLPPSALLPSNVTLVAGPPCAGKSTYVQKRARPGDLVLDWDLLLRAMTPTEGRDHVDPGQLKPIVFAARDAVEAELARHPHVRAWIINNAPTRAARDRYRQRLRAHVVVVLAGRETCLARAAMQRPPAWRGYVERWFARYERDPRDEVVDAD